VTQNAVFKYYYNFCVYKSLLSLIISDLGSSTAVLLVIMAWSSW